MYSKNGEKWKKQKKREENDGVRRRAAEDACARALSRAGRGAAVSDETWKSRG